MGGALRHATPHVGAYAGEAQGAVRRQAGLFDLSIMAHFVVWGPGTLAFGGLTIDGLPEAAEPVALPFYDPSRRRVRAEPAPA